MRWWLAVLAAAAAGCAPTRILHRRPVPAPRPAAERLTVALEPFFENAEVVYRRDLAEVSPADGSLRTRQYVEVTTPVKPFLARPESLDEEHRRALALVRKLRPTWTVVSTAELAPLEGLVVLVRTVVGKTTPAGSDRWVVATLPLLWAANITEVVNVDGVLARYTLDAPQLQERILRYPAQPDFAVDTTGLAGRSQPFTFDLEYQEQVFTDPRAHDEALLAGFSERLAEAVVALVEGS